MARKMTRKKGGKTLLCLLIAAFFLYLIIGGGREGKSQDKNEDDGSWISAKFLRKYPAKCGRCKAAWKAYKNSLGR